jgi:hypothetical protein
MPLNQGLYPTKFRRTKPKVLGHRDRTNPEFARFFVPVHMHMGRLIRFMTIEIKSVRPRSENGRHVDTVSLI